MAQQLLDTRSLAKPALFSGNNKDWPAWEFTLLSSVSLLSTQVAEVMEATMRLPESVDLVDSSEDNTALAHQLFHLLVMLRPKGKTVPILMGAERGNGFAAYKAIKLEMEPQVGGRHAAMLAGLISPQGWNKVDDLDKWRTEFVQWELSIARYGNQSGERVSNALSVEDCYS